MARLLKYKTGNFLDVIKYASIHRCIEAIADHNFSSWTYLDIFPNNGKIKLERNNNKGKHVDQGLDLLLANNTLNNKKHSLTNFISYLQDFNHLKRNNYNYNEFQYYPTSLDIARSFLSDKDHGILYQFDNLKYKQLNTYLHDDVRFSIINNNDNINIMNDPLYLNCIKKSITTHIPRTSNGLAMIDFGNTMITNYTAINEIIKIIELICQEWITATKFIILPIHGERPFNLFRRILKTGQSNILTSEILINRNLIHGMAICIINPPKYMDQNLYNIIYDSGIYIQNKEFLYQATNDHDNIQQQVPDDDVSYHQYIEHSYQQLSHINQLNNQQFDQVIKGQAQPSNIDDLGINLDDVNPEAAKAVETVETDNAVNVKQGAEEKEQGQAETAAAALQTGAPVAEKKSQKILHTINKLKHIEQSKKGKHRPRAYVNWLTKQANGNDDLKFYDQDYQGYNPLDEQVLDMHIHTFDPKMNELSKDFSKRFDQELQQATQTNRAQIMNIKNSNENLTLSKQMKLKMKQIKNLNHVQAQQQKDFKKAQQEATGVETSEQQVIQAQKSSKVKTEEELFPLETQELNYKDQTVSLANPKLFPGKLGQVDNSITNRFLTQIHNTGYNFDETIKILDDGRPSYLTQDHETLPAKPLQSTFVYNLQEDIDLQQRKQELEDAWAYLDSFKTKTKKNPKS